MVKTERYRKNDRRDDDHDDGDRVNRCPNTEAMENLAFYLERNSAVVCQLNSCHRMADPDYRYLHFRCLESNHRYHSYHSCHSYHQQIQNYPLVYAKLKPVAILQALDKSDNSKVRMVVASSLTLKLAFVCRRALGTMHRCSAEMHINSVVACNRQLSA